MEFAGGGLWRSVDGGCVVFCFEETELVEFCCGCVGCRFSFGLGGGAIFLFRDVVRVLRLIRKGGRGDGFASVEWMGKSTMGAVSRGGRQTLGSKGLVLMIQLKGV
jgi:hypothetical protein